MLRGFDVSFLTDWAALRAEHGISFGIARCMRSTEAKDAAFDANWQRMAELDDFVRMAYVFASPALGVDAVEDARLAWQYVTAAGPLMPTDVFWLDLEQSILGQDDTNDWAEAWFDEFVRLNRADGYTHVPSLYNGGYLMNRTGTALNQRFASLWYPRPESQYDNVWPTTFIPKLPLGAASWADTNWGVPPDIWQCSFHWQVPGFPEHDANVYAGTLDQLRSLSQEADVALTPADVKLILDTEIPRVTPVPKPDGTTDTTITVRDALRYAYDRATKSWVLDTAQAQVLAALPDQIAALADPDEIKAVVAEAFAPYEFLQPGK